MTARKGARTRQVSYWLDLDLLAWLEEEAQATGQTKTEVVTAALKTELARLVAKREATDHAAAERVGES